MNRTAAVLAAVVLAAGSVTLPASGGLGIYAVIERVAFEPNEKAPERLRLWGAFAYVEASSQGTMVSEAKRGYMYFRLASAADGVNQTAIDVMRREWADLKGVAASGQAVGFGSWSYIGDFVDLRPDASGSRPPYIWERSPGRPRTDLRVRPDSEPPSLPALYQTDIGVVKLAETGSHAAVVKQLKAALKQR
jgi:hypothetical protein